MPHNSITETYVAARFFVDNWRWSGVPFYLRHGKRYQARHRNSIHFKPAPHALFQHTSADELQPNVLVLHSSRTGVSPSVRVEATAPQYACAGGHDSSTGRASVWNGRSYEPSLWTR